MRIDSPSGFRNWFNRQDKTNYFINRLRRTYGQSQLDSVLGYGWDD